ncbi:unnamed protein product [Colias eurytheme]|nr:unnamed protein product [Colias eurytheme]
MNKEKQEKSQGELYSERIWQILTYKTSDTEFKNRFRLSKEAFLFLCRELKEKSSLKSSKRYSLEHKVLCALSFYATGSYQRIVGMAKYLGQTTRHLVRQIMPYKRFLMIKRFLHFSDNLDVDPTASTHAKKLRKIQPITDHLRDKFRNLYNPEQQISLDESLLMWKGRLNFSQKIATKAAQVGIKSYEICESKSGYLWDFKIYTGKTTNKDDATEHTHGTDENTPDGTTAGIVYDLMRFDKDNMAL